MGNWGLNVLRQMEQLHPGASASFYNQFISYFHHKKEFLPVTVLTLHHLYESLKWASKDSLQLTEWPVILDPLNISPILGITHAYIYFLMVNRKCKHRLQAQWRGEMIRW